MVTISTGKSWRCIQNRKTPYLQVLEEKKISALNNKFGADFIPGSHVNGIPWDLDGGEDIQCAERKN